METNNSVLEQVSALTPLLKSSAPEQEAQRHLSEEVVAAMRKAGLFRILLPKAYGGLELPMKDALEVIAAVSAADGAAGWCLLKGAASNQMAGYLPEETAKQIWQDPSVVVAGNFNPVRGKAVRAPGGWYLSGRWDWGTGARHSQWLIGGGMEIPSADAQAPLMTDKGPVVKAFIFEAALARYSDTWFTHGMCATGSIEFAVDNLFVPDAFVFDGVFAKPTDPGVPYRLPYAEQAALPHGALAVGIARGALANFKELATTKTPLMTRSLLAQRERIQHETGLAVAAVEAAWATLLFSTDAAWGNMPGLPAGARLTLAATQATHACVDAVDRLYRMAGGTAVFSASPLQRQWRDIHVAASHILVNEDKYTSLGQAFLGAY